MSAPVTAGGGEEGGKVTPEGEGMRRPHDLGMATVLVVPRITDPYREAFEQEAVHEPHIDHITDDLAGFLVGCVQPEIGQL